MWSINNCLLCFYTVVIAYYFMLRRTTEPRRTHEKDRYDLVIVGGGTGGLALLHEFRLQEDQRVLLIEAGGSASWRTAIPLMAPMLLVTEDTFHVRTTKQQYSHLGFHDQVSHWYGGRSLGGTGTINFHIHNITKVETRPDIVEGISKSSDGPIKQAFLSSTADGAILSPTFNLIKDGRRHNAAQTFLLGQRNAHILSGQVSQLHLESGRATKLALQNGQTISCDGACKIVLSAGAINTPRILWQSGIGPREELEKIQIETKLDLPVGKGLFDHLTYPLYFNLNATRSSGSVNLATLLNPANLVQYALASQGVWNSSAIDAQAMFPDESVLVLLYTVGAPNSYAFTKISNMKQETFDALFPNHHQLSKEGFILLAICLDPKSRGSLSFKTSSGEFLDPVANPNYLQHVEDLDCMKRAVRRALSLGQDPALSRLGASVHTPDLPGCSHLTPDFQDDSFLECIIRTAAMTMYHPAGTALEAIDDEFRLRGVSNVHICDASVVSQLTDGFPSQKIMDTAKKVAATLIN